MDLGRISTASGEVETWVEWVKRATPVARNMLQKFKIPSWSEEVTSRYTKWRNKLATMSIQRWARRALDWEPDGYRARGKPLVRWADQAHT